MARFKEVWFTESYTAVGITRSGYQLSAQVSMKFRLVNEPDRIVQKNLSPSEAEKLADLLKAYAEKARTINEGR